MLNLRAFFIYFCDFGYTILKYIIAQNQQNIQIDYIGLIKGLAKELNGQGLFRYQ